MATDFLIEANANPVGLDQTLNQMGAALIGAPDYIMKDGCYVMRVFGSNPGYVKFACENQGYCKIVRQLEELV